MNKMMLPPHLQHAVVAGLIRERHAEAAEARLAASLQQPLIDALRRRVGHGFVVAEAGNAREGLVEGSGEPLAVPALDRAAGQPCPEHEVRPAA